MSHSRSVRTRTRAQQVAIGIACCFFGIVVWLAMPAKLAAQTVDAGVTATVIDSAAQSVTVKFSLADYEIETVMQDGVSYQQVRIGELPQSIDEALPQVPIHGVLIGLPTIEGIKIEVLDVDYRDLYGYDFMPAATLVLDEGDFDVLGDERLHEIVPAHASWSGHAGFLPEAPAALAKSGHMRGQAVSQVQFYPVAYNPATRTARIYHTVTARVTWDSLATDENRIRQYSAAFEPVLRQTLLNYADLAPARVFTANDDRDAAEPRVGGDGSDSIAELIPLAKIVVDEDALYRIDYALLNSVLSESQLEQLDPAELAMTNQGEAVAIELQGMDDGEFDMGDAIVFYGAKIQREPFGDPQDECGQFTEPAPDYLFTSENVYWLGTDREHALRMESIDVERPAPDTKFSTSFPVTRHFEQDERYWQTMLSQNCADRWFWQSRIGYPSSVESGLPSMRDYELDIDGSAIDGAIAETLKINMAGYSSSNHSYKILADGTELPPANNTVWRGQRPITRLHTFSSGALAGKTKVTVTVEALDEGEGVNNQFLVNWMQLKFNQTYATTSDRSHFSNSSAGNPMKVGGFTSPEIVLYDISARAAPQRLHGWQLVSEGGSHAIAFVDPDDGQPVARRCQNVLVTGRCYLAMTDDKYTEPKLISIDQEPSTNVRDVNASYLIVTESTFRGPADELADYRRTNDGLSTAVVTVDDIFDEFGDGIANPKAIRDFLDYGYHCWQNRPEFVVFMGDANQDGRDIYGFGNNYVPTQIFESTLFGEVASDTWFGLMADSSCDSIAQDDTQNSRDTLPDIFLGRISVQTPEEANIVVEKIKTYERTELAEPWKRQILYVADDEGKFVRTLDLLEETVPGHMTIQRENTPPDAHDQPAYAMAERIAAAINGGKAIVGYVGHGDYNGWGRWDAQGEDELHYIFHVDYVKNLLKNASKLPFVMVGNCLNGYFSGPTKRPAMAEVLIREADKGAVAVWAPTGLGYPSGHRVLLSEFNNSLFAGGERQLGVITNTAYTETYATNTFWEELIWTYVLFGDPYMDLSVPQHISQIYLPLTQTTP